MKEVLYNYNQENPIRDLEMGGSIGGGGAVNGGRGGIEGWGRLHLILVCKFDFSM